MHLIIYITKNKSICHHEKWLSSLFVANSSICFFFFFSLLLLFYELFEKSCHLSHCCSRQQGQVEEFTRGEQCSWSVLKQRRQFDVSTSPRWTKKLHPQSREVDNCRRCSSQSLTRGSNTLSALFWTSSTCSLHRSRLIRKTRSHNTSEVWLQQLIIGAVSRDCFFFCELALVSVCALLSATHT